VFALAIAAALRVLATDVVADEISRVTEALFDYIEFRRASQAAHKELLRRFDEPQREVARVNAVREQFGWQRLYCF